MTDNKTLGERLRVAREAKGLSGVDLAQALDITKQAVSHIENGRVEVTMETVKKVCAVLDVDPVQIMTS